MVIFIVMREILENEGRVWARDALSSQDLNVLEQAAKFSNKSMNKNWALPWHQDRVIAVNTKIDHNGYINWSQKSGIWHCEPPTDLLDNMFFARVHFDDCQEDNGCLQVALKSHKYGKILATDIYKTIATLDKELCSAKRGDILFVKALTLHRSLSSQSSLPRRALRIDYSATTLPSPLRWAI